MKTNKEKLKYKLKHELNEKDLIIEYKNKEKIMEMNRYNNK